MTGASHLSGHLAGRSMRYDDVAGKQQQVRGEKGLIHGEN